MLAEPANVSQHLLPFGALWRNSLGAANKVNLDHKEDWAIQGLDGVVLYESQTIEQKTTAK